MPTVLESDPSQAYDALRRGVDLAIMTEAPVEPWASAAVAVLPVWAYVRADHPWSTLDCVTIEQLADETVLALTPMYKPRQILDRALVGTAAPRLVDCSNAQVAQALAAAGRGVAVVSDDPRFDLHPVEIVGPDGPLRIELFAAWEPGHHAAPTMSDLAARLRQFCIVRYGADVAP